MLRNLIITIYWDTFKIYDQNYNAYMVYNFHLRVNGPYNFFSL